MTRLCSLSKFGVHFGAMIVDGSTAQLSAFDPANSNDILVPEGHK
jgi:hypothetical protein